ncbi:hypothetical protein ABZ260_06200 [Streptosporangium sp. NPDC006013]|uniref:hypothetical protein n=1 Tax=Streptosporangium sp. NPDC006013 TaxID=3155596 RepID=UPI0033B689CC
MHDGDSFQKLIDVPAPLVSPVSEDEGAVAGELLRAVDGGMQYRLAPVRPQGTPRLPAGLVV